MNREQCGVGLRQVWSWTQPGERKGPRGANPSQAGIGEGGCCGEMTEVFPSLYPVLAQAPAHPCVPALGSRDLPTPR